MKKYSPFMQVSLHPRFVNLRSQAYHFIRSNLLGKKLSFPYVVLSFPKSGRTWLRAILGKYLELTHGIVFTTEFDNVARDKLPKIKFTHNLHRMSYFSGKIIFLTRDPRDVVVSYYYQKKYRDNHIPGISGQKDNLSREITHAVQIMCEFDLWKPVSSYVIKLGGEHYSVGQF